MPSLKDRWKLKPRSVSQSSDKGKGDEGTAQEEISHDGGGGERVHGWATDFERLLNDPVGLRTFTVSLIKMCFLTSRRILLITTTAASYCRSF